MKKLIIVTIIAAFFAACSNTPAANESTTTNATLKAWVDSVKGLADADTACDAAKWTAWNTEYEGTVNKIVEADLDDANKTTLAESKAKWTEAGTTYSACITKREEAAKQAAMPKDTMAVVPVAPVDPKKEETKKAH